MGATRALVTLRRDVIYINNEEAASAFLADVAQHWFAQSGELGDVLIDDFKQRMASIGQEVGSQVAMTASTGIPLSTGGRAYQAARHLAPRSAVAIRKAARGAGGAKHDLASVAQASQLRAGAMPAPQWAVRKP